MLLAGPSYQAHSWDGYRQQKTELLREESASHDLQLHKCVSCEILLYLLYM